MIDSGTTRNFMSDKFAKNYQIPGLLKEWPYQFTVVNRTILNKDEGMVKKEIPLLRTQINGKDWGKQYLT